MSDDPNAGFRAELKGIYAEIWDKAHAAGHEAGMREAVEVLQSMKTAWESLGGNQYHSPKAVEQWLWDDMKPVMDNLRAFLASYDAERATMEKPRES